MNIHISHDDKFLDLFIENVFSFSKSSNRFIVFAKNKELKYTKNTDKIDVLDLVTDGFEDILKLHPEKITNIYFHSLSTFFAELILTNQLWKGHKLYWLFFGYELFSLKENIPGLLTKENFNYYKQNNPELYFKFTFNPIKLRRNLINYRHYSEKKVCQEEKIRKAIKRIDYFCHFIKDDYEQYVKSINPKIEHVDWAYGITNDKDSFLSEEDKTDNSILFGNSASIFNNHLDGLTVLKKCIGEKTNWKIITPLSYGGTPDYINAVRSKGKLLFGDNFVPIDHYLDKEKYFDLISNVKGAVYFNIRSQGAGNITWLLKQKIPVFMLSENNLFKFFTRFGVKIFTIQSDLTPFLENNHYDKTEVKLNPDKLQIYFSNNNLKYKYQNLLGS